MAESSSLFGVGVQLVRQSRFQTRSALFFLVLFIISGSIWWALNPLQADEPTDQVIELTLATNGNLYSQNSRVPTENTIGDKFYQIRYQVIDQPNELIDELAVRITLPQTAKEGEVGFRFINNGGALEARSEQIDPSTIAFTAIQVSPQAQLVIELEVPKSWLKNSSLFKVREFLVSLPPITWLAVSVALFLTTLMILLTMRLASLRRPKRLPAIAQPPDNLKPALVGILLNGRITSRDLAATFIDLARRGHLVIRFDGQDFRFTRRASPDLLEDFEQELMDQLFGQSANRVDYEEVSLTINQELFSKRISRAFIMAYRRVYAMGYFYTSPLSVHRRYQLTGALLFLLAVTGFVVNLIFFVQLAYALIFWLAMMACAVLIARLSKDLPVRTLSGDRAAIKWLMFAEHLKAIKPLGYLASAQDTYFAYLPYAVVMESEAEWTHRFYNLPFAAPTWYVSQETETIDLFANRLFPLFGYLSFLLTNAAPPAAR